MPRLENWSIQTLTDSQGEYSRLLGNVYEDPRFLEGGFIHTSEIVEIDEENGIAKTRNTTYRLGEKLVR